jgi:predicted nucleotidyltransferase
MPRFATILTANLVSRLTGPAITSALGVVTAVPKSGTIIPEMGRPTLPPGQPLSMVASALFTPVQQRVLGLLFGQPDRRFQSAELIRLAQGGTGAVHRQLKRLAAAGLVVVSSEGNQKYYTADKESPVFAEIRGLIIKTVAIVDPLRAALRPVAKKIRFAFVYGSIAKGEERAESDVDLLVVSDSLTYPDAYEALQPAEQILSRTINPTVMTPDEWRKKRSASDSFAKRIAAQPKLFVIGDEHAIG